MLFLLKYWNIFPEVDFELYTYGAPRVGNKAFVDYINNLSMPVARVVNGKDAAPQLFFASLGYVNYHNELYLTNDGHGHQTARFCSTEFYEDPNCSQGIGLAHGLYAVLVTLIIDHLTYFGINVAECGLTNPIEFIMQLIYPIQPYIPIPILEKLPKFPIRSELLLEWKQFTESGIKELLNTASMSSTYLRT